MAGLDHIRTDGRPDPENGFLDTPMGLSRLEAWALNAVRRWGPLGLTVRASIAAVLGSVLISVAVMIVIVGPGATMISPGLVLSSAVPTIVAPPVIAVIVRLIARLDATGQELVSAATTDPLTGVFNRRGFFDGFDATEIAEGPLAVAIVDVDDFKQLNDRFGHPKGDAILRHLATLLVEHAEEEGVVARLGGDEFVLVAPSDAIRRLHTREILTSAAVAYSATVGKADLGDDGLQAALATADAELYRHKSNRRRGRTDD
ncbi:MAG: GGDEF domain-containing protein [Actinomycetota bacterium]